MRLGPMIRGAAAASLILVGGITAGLELGATVAAAAVPSKSMCDGGTLASGTYTSLTVNAGCLVTGVVTVNGPVTVSGAGGVLIVLPQSSLAVKGSFSVSDGASSEANGAFSVSGSFSIGQGSFFGGNLRLNGGLTASGDSGFLLQTGSSVSGSIRAVNQEQVDLTGTTVGGSVTIQGTTNVVEVLLSTIAGPLVVTGNNDSGASIFQDTTGPLTFSDNDSSFGSQIGSTTVNGPLTCSDNVPPPSVSGNVVSGPIRGDQAAACGKG